MKRRPLCVDCGEAPKRPGSTKYCEECWLIRQPMPVQVAAARARLAQTPVEERKRMIPARLWPPDRRWCGGCQSFRRLRDFGTNATRCKPCASAASHAQGIKADFGISGEEYDLLFAAQYGRCWLCHRKSPSRRLAVDHDHKTGEVRGLLCPDPEWGCNLKVVPRFDAADDPPRMARRLVLYLSDPPARKVLGK